MAALPDLSPSERELESLWRSFHRAWVSASDDLARVEAQLLAEHGSGGVLDAPETQMISTMRAHERHARQLLDTFERTYVAFRSRTARYRRGNE